jgi:hypothetical protein
MERYRQSNAPQRDSGKLGNVRRSASTPRDERAKATRPHSEKRATGGRCGAGLARRPIPCVDMDVRNCALAMPERRNGVASQ